MAEVLTLTIREEEAIKGITILETEHKLTLFTNDLTGFTQEIPSLKRMLDGIEITQLEDIEITQQFLTLGFWFSSSNEESFNFDWNFKPILKKMASYCESWEHHLKGKITVLNTPSSNTFAQFSTPHLKW